MPNLYCSHEPEMIRLKPVWTHVVLLHMFKCLTIWQVVKSNNMLDHTSFTATCNMISGLTF